MLSRIAESVFWIGRYLERADDTARLLDVQIHDLLEDVVDARANVPEALLSVMGVPMPKDGIIDLDEVVHLLAFSASQPSSIVSSVHAARENARSARESLTSELWECLNSTAIQVDPLSATAREIDAHQFFRFSLYIRERVAMAGGIAEASMSRDESWRFLLLGRSIERADMTARLLATRLHDLWEDFDWAPTLRACSAYEAYLRTYHGAMSSANAVEFLMLDRHFPRSIYFSLASAESCLNDFEARHVRVGSDDEASRVIGRTRAELGYRTISELLEQAPRYLRDVQEACAMASRAIARDYFQREATRAWHIGGETEAEVFA